MTVKELKEIIQELPDDMPVTIPYEEEGAITLCKDGFELVSFPIENEDEEGGFSFVDVLLLRPCMCSSEGPVTVQEPVLN